MDSDAVLSFWFDESGPKFWFRKDAKFDQLVTERFAAVHCAASAGELYSWRSDPRGRLAEIIVLDQFSRNIYRDSPSAFIQDGMALVLAQEAVAAGADQTLSSAEAAFMFMPYMHSESRLIHERAVALFSRGDLEDSMRFELRHQQIIERFGRYPHRNAILGRKSSPEEVEFLEMPGSKF